MLDRIGRLDEGMFMYYEDLDLCFRAGRAGWKVCYLPDARVVHLGGATSRRTFGPMLVASGRSSFYFFRKHYGDGAVRLLRLITLPEMALRSALWGTLVLFSGRRRAEARERLCAYRTILWRPASALTPAGLRLPPLSQERERGNTSPPSRHPPCRSRGSRPLPSYKKGGENTRKRDSAQGAPPETLTAGAQQKHSYAGDTNLGATTERQGCGAPSPRGA
jgi:hypothetical protein